MKRITKIVCTLGPASSDLETMTAMFKSGMNVARLNMSHGTHESHQKLIDTMAPLRKKGLKLMIDTKGPEIRIGTFAQGYTLLSEGQMFSFTTRDIVGDDSCVSLKYKNLIKNVRVGDRIFANNGLLVLRIQRITQTDIICVVEFGGKLSDNKSLNVPGVVPDTPFVSPTDESDILFALNNNADYLALSFVSSAKNVLSVRNLIAKHKPDAAIQLVSKIENAHGVNHAAEILDISDGLMVARGDLGVEIPLHKIPPIQKKLISLCNVKKKICIVATEMLESMTYSTRPTRAEVNDVAAAIYEEATATMLSGETAAGKNPLLVVQTMANIIDEVEKHMYKVRC